MRACTCVRALLAGAAVMRASLSAQAGCVCTQEKRGLCRGSCPAHGTLPLHQVTHPHTPGTHLVPNLAHEQKAVRRAEGGAAGTLGREEREGRFR